MILLQEILKDGGNLEKHCLGRQIFRKAWFLLRKHLSYSKEARHEPSELIALQSKAQKKVGSIWKI